MISDTVASEAQFYSELKALGYEPTTERTGTGTLWRHTKTHLYIIVPDSEQGFYPRWLTDDLMRYIKSLPAMPSVN